MSHLQRLGISKVNDFSDVIYFGKVTNFEIGASFRIVLIRPTLTGNCRHLEMPRPSLIVYLI